MKHRFVWMEVALGVLFVAGAVAWLSKSRTAEAANPAGAVTYSLGMLHASIAYQAQQAAEGPLTLELLNPEDEVLERSLRNVSVRAGKGEWLADLKLAKSMPLEDLVWQRLRYRFEPADRKTGTIAGVISISRVLRSPVMHILGQQSYLSGGEAAVRVIVTDSRGDSIAGQSSLRIDLVTPDQKMRRLYADQLNPRGTAQAHFRLPAGLAGSYQLKYVVDTPIGTTEFSQTVQVQEKSSILLTTEKPIYQPGQTIHVRALSLDKASHEATGERKLTFEVEDSRGNKVFKKETQTSKFGVASAEFALADEVNLGTYHVRALLEANSAEIALSVERYVLPKFRVALEFSGKSRHGYRPGEHVTGTVRSNYFFGKPVSGEVLVKASSLDVAVFEAATAHGKTDAEGNYRFDLKLPEYFAGRPLSGGAALVLIEATVKDSAGHSETHGDPITVSQSPLLITAVPEGGTLVPSLENQVFILTSYADGKPARTDIRAAGQSVSTDEGGVAVLRLKAGLGPEKLQVQADDRQGNRISTEVNLQTRSGGEQILLRTEHAVYHAGDRMRLQVFSTKERGSAYVDVVKDGQTVLTRDLEIVNGRAELSLAVGPGLAGTLDLNAYLFGRNAIPVADHRLVFVQPAEELKIEASTDRAVYKPGEEARVRFRVTNGRGEGVEAALGLQVVDEAVFALAEKQPGFAKVFFYLEQEAMKPRFEIHSIGMEQAMERDQAARALFAATEMVNSKRFQTEVGRSIPMNKYAVYHDRYAARFQKQAADLAKVLSRAYQQESGAELTHLAARLPANDARNMTDFWGGELSFEQVSWNTRQYLLRSSGPDQTPNTVDDLYAYLEIRGKPASGGKNRMDLNVEHERGPFNGMAEMGGSVGEGTVIMVRSKLGAHTVKANANGLFSIAGLAPGEYQVRLQNGAAVLLRTVTLDARDRAVVAAIWTGGSGEVVVSEMRVFRNDGGGWRGAMGGVMNGAMGGVAGGIPGPRANAVAAPMALDRMEMMRPSAGLVLKESLNTATVVQQEPAAPRVRSYFPEALYINPQILTDRDGRASITIPIADSITTWRMAMIASTVHGALGTATSSLKVFQDFFVDLDLPVTLTQGDRVQIPVAAYNYSGSAGDVHLELKPAEWFALVDDVGRKNVAVEAGRVGGSQFTIEARHIGKFKLTLAARLTGATDRADIVVREIEVVPNGREQNQVFNGRLETSVSHDLQFPAAAIDEASTVFVRLYPGPLSQVVEGMDAILRMPGGCFEQTSSSTYPNVLALDYMKRTNKLTPEVHAKAEGFIANGYQRLLTFEVPGGGFSWFGQAPANKILTSYGLMEFSDMSKVYDVDPKLIRRTGQWLASEQQGDGSWKPDTSFINEGATNRFNSDALRITGYIAWSLQNTGYQGPAVEKAKQFVAGHLNGKTDPYTLAVLANFAVEYGKDRDFTRDVMQRLLDARTEAGEKAWWTSEETGVYATGASAAVETTGLAAQALLKWGQASAVVRKALAYVASKKDASGTWGTTQATIMALRALLLSTDKGASDVRGTVEVTLNGKEVEKLILTPANNDLLHQFVFKGIDAKAANRVGIRFEGKGGLAYQVVGRSFVPWGQARQHDALSITVDYDRTKLLQDDIATATATVRSNLGKVANMVMIDLGIPPGFDLLTEDLQAMVEKTAGQKGGRLEKFSLTTTQAILYLDSIGARETVTLKYRLRAKYPIRARTFQSRVYEYYDPEVNAVAVPVQIEVAAKRTGR